MNPKLKFIHPNMKGTGTTVEFELRPATELDMGCMLVSFTPQKTIGDMQKRVFPTFDYEKKVTVKLTLLEVAEIVGVLKGYYESIAEGNGFFHKSPKGTTVVRMEHKVEPAPGYWFSVYRKNAAGEESKAGILFKVVEALALQSCFEGAMFYMGFGDVGRYGYRNGGSETTSAEKKSV